MEILLVWLLLAVGVAVLAEYRGRNSIAFFLLSAVLSPLLGLIVVLVMEDKTKAAKADEQRKKDHERELESIKAIAGARGQVSAGPSLADELAKLAGLRDRSVITEAEFQEQKRALLAKSSSQ